MKQEGETFVVSVPAGHEERAAQRVLQAVEHTHERPEPVRPTGWEWIRTRLLNVENLGTLLALVAAAILLAVVVFWLWELASIMGWLVLLLVVVAGLVFFHFSGIPHSAVKSPRPYSHKHDITMGMEQEVQYRLAWARDDYRKARRWRFGRRRRKE